MKFTVTGPGVEKSCPSGPVGLSAAITAASNADDRAADEATYYVRDEAGDCYGRVTRLADSGVVVFGPRQLGYREPSGGLPVAQAPGRRTSTTTTTTSTNEEDQMAVQKKNPRSSARSAGPREAAQREQREAKADAPKADAANGAPAAPAEPKQQEETAPKDGGAKAAPPKNGAAAKKAPAAKPEQSSGADLFKGVQAALRDAKAGTVKPHSGGLYARLMDGKRTVGYIVTRKTGVRAYPNCLASAMPKGLSFTKCELGAHHYGRGEVIIDVASEGDYKDVVKAMEAAKANPIPRAGAAQS